MDRNDKQKELSGGSLTEHIFASGRPGTGKTSAGCDLLGRMLESQLPWKRTLVLTPAASAGEAYRQVMTSQGRKAWVTTFNGFIQHNLNLFWPVIAEDAGFPRGAGSPLFLNIETAQVVLQSVVAPYWESGALNVLRWAPNRFLNQAAMAMHKMAAIGLPFERYAERMRSSWVGDDALKPVFDLVQRIGLTFKQICREDNMLDFALQLEIYHHVLAHKPVYQNWLKSQFQFIICDNIEEDIPLAHAFIQQIRTTVDGSLVIYDSLGGFRSFMGGDPESALRLRSEADREIEFSDSFVTSPSIQSLSRAIEDPTSAIDETMGDPRDAYRFTKVRHYPRMIKEAARDIATLVHGHGVDPREIVLIAPLVSDVLYMMFERELRMQNVDTVAIRASRGLAAEADSRCLLTLLALLRPAWGYLVRGMDLIQMLRFFIPGLDPIRAQRFVLKAFKKETGEDGSAIYTPILLSELPEKAGSELSQAFLSAWDRLSGWIVTHRDTDDSPDQLMSDFFHQVLTQPGFAAFTDVTPDFPVGFIRLIESLKTYRRAMEALPEGRLSWKMYMDAIASGMVSATYYGAATGAEEPAVLVALPGAFVGLNRPYRYQFWLNAGSTTWWERPLGPLTNDAVLSLSWKEGDLWDEMKKYQRNQLEMQRMIQSLLARCGERVYVYASELDESGKDQKSVLLYLFAELSVRLKKEASGDF